MFKKRTHIKKQQFILNEDSYLGNEEPNKKNEKEEMIE